MANLGSDRKIQLPPPYNPPLLQTNQGNTTDGQSEDRQSETYFVQAPSSWSQTGTQLLIERPEEKKSSHQKVKNFVPPPSSWTFAEAQPMILVQPSPATGTIFYAQQPTPSQLDFRRRYTDLRVLACLVCLFCFWPIGICALISANQDYEDFKRGRIKDGKSNQMCTKVLISLSVIIGVAICVLMLVMQETRQTWGY